MRHTPSDQAPDHAGEQGHPAGLPGTRPRRRPRYGFLLLLLIACYLLSAFFSATWINDSQLLLFTIAVLLAIRNSGMRARMLRVLLGSGLLASLIIIVLGVHHGGDIGRGMAEIWSGALLLLTVVLIVRQVLGQASVTVQSIYGAISAYLIIGLMFAAFYSAMWWLNGRVFFAPEGNHAGGVANFQYFSFTTLTTLGYGDYTAISAPGRAVAMLEAMTGQIFLATLVAKLVAAFRPARGSAGAAAGAGDPATREGGPGALPQTAVVRTPSGRRRPAGVRAS